MKFCIDLNRWEIAWLLVAWFVVNVLVGVLTPTVKFLGEQLRDWWRQ